MDEPAHEMTEREKDLMLVEAHAIICNMDTWLKSYLKDSQAFIPYAGMIQSQAEKWIKDYRKLRGYRE